MIYPKLHISRINLKSGGEIELSENDLVILSGPNNSGKSQFLKDLYSRLRGDSEKELKIIENTDVVRSFNPGELVEHLEQSYPKTFSKGDNIALFSVGLNVNYLKSMAIGQTPLNNMISVFAHYADTKT